MRRRIPSPFDQLAKGVAREALSEAGMVETELEVAAAAQRMDLWHEPDPHLVATRARLGLLGELTAEPCQIEPFSTTPGLRQVRACIRKQLQWHHQRELNAGRRLPLPRLFVSSTGRPAKVLQEMGFTEVQPGVHRSAPAHGIYVLVLSELPRDNSTLLLRLMGGGRILMEAIEDVLALPDEAWEKQMALPWLVRLGMLLPERRASKEAVMTEVREWFERYKKDLVQKSRREAQQQTLGRLFGKRLGRPLTAKERASLRRRLSQLGENRVADVLLNTSPRELAAWLTDRAAS